MMDLQDIYNYLKINDKLITSGQPTEEELRIAANVGVQVVINLATLESDTTLPDEEGLVHSLGMSYVHIPVMWENPTEDDFTEFVRTMRQSTGKNTLIHCVANYRVTVFFSLYAMKEMGWTVEQADALIAEIWEGGPYPIWAAFVNCMRERL